MSPAEIKLRLKQFYPAVICGVLAVVLIAVVFLRGGAIQAAKSEISNLEDEKRRITANLNNGRDFEAQLERLKTFYEQVEPRLMVYEEFDPIARVGDRQRNLQYFSALASEHNFVLSALPAQTQGALNQLTHYRVLHFDLQGTSTLADIAAFFNALHEDDFYIVPVHWNLRPPANAEAPSIQVNTRVQVLAKRPTRP